MDLLKLKNTTIQNDTKNIMKHKGLMLNEDKMKFIVEKYDYYV
jgi:hypothetical protein